MFSSLPDPAVNLFMDASNEGLCVLYPARKELVRLQFDDAEKEMIKKRTFSINVREQLSSTFAVLCWGPSWAQSGSKPLTHVRMWIDNTSAVSWCNHLYSRNEFSQELNRVLGAAEAEWSLRVSAAHLAGQNNFLADLGSRTKTHDMVSTNLVVDAGTGTDAHTQILQRAMHALQQRSLADTSKRQYAATLRKWCKFCKRIGKPKWLPDEDPKYQSLQLVLFAVERWSSAQQRDIGTIQSELSHVRWYHRVFAGCEPKLTPGHATAIAGMRRISPPTTPRAPVSIGMLEWIARNTSVEETQQRLVLGATLLGFFFALRSSEYLAVKGGRHRYALEVRDVEVFDSAMQPTRSGNDAQVVSISLRGSKTDQIAKGVTRYLHRSGNPRICPVRAGLLLLQLASHNGLQSQEPICSLERGRQLKAKTISKVLQRAAASTGCDQKLYSCHSLRSGGATAMLAGGVDSTTIKLHGRWSSDTFQRYTRYTSAVGTYIAGSMVGTREFGNSYEISSLGRGSRHNGVPPRR
ncbi:Hypothetical protein PHPALM_36772 [Phytophthora palmivora]|uniref:Tyr recombinase domain-containing protein n=1 Tax=Phytophthora palmivora TaxID=4796 RepID=A0A2P4WZ38_9STRA|nr:Hypothetical protein PHPALM_36772 [Phytophthora palmivora]